MSDANREFFLRETKKSVTRIYLDVVALLCEVSKNSNKHAETPRLGKSRKQEIDKNEGEKCGPRVIIPIPYHTRRSYYRASCMQPMGSQTGPSSSTGLAGTEFFA